MNLSEQPDQPPGGQTCRRCGGIVAPDAQRCPACGTWQPRNTGALRHGLRSQQLAAAALPEQAEARALLAQRERAISADMGGDISTLQADLVRRYLQTAMIADHLAEDMMRRGALTSRGRARAALSAFMLIVDRQHRLASALGLQRRARPVDAFSALRDAVERANAPGEER